jgi:hypothetical protein
MSELLQSTEVQRGMSSAGRARAERLFDLDTNVATLAGWFDAARRAGAAR